MSTLTAPASEAALPEGEWPSSLAFSAEEQRRLSDLALLAHQSLDLEATCRRILGGLPAVLPGIRGAALYLPQPEGDFLELADRCCGWRGPEAVEIESAHEIAGAYRSGFGRWSREEASRGAGARWRGYAPLPAGCAAVGTLAVEVETEPTGTERALLLAAGSAVAGGIAHAQAYRRMGESRDQMATIARRKASQQVETELRAHGERLLNDLHGVVHESADPERIVQLAAPMLRSALHASRCIALLAADGEYRDYAACDADYPMESGEVLWEASDLVQMVENAGRAVCIYEPRELREYRTRRHDPAKPPASLLAVPAIRQDRLMAIFIYHHCEGRRTWTESEVDLATRAAEQVATALHNARLYQAAIAAEQVQRMLVEIQTAKAGPTELVAILEAIARHGMTLLGADAGWVWQVDAGEDDLVGIVAAGHRADRFEGLRTPLRRGRSLAIAALQEGRTLVSHDTENDPRVNQRVRRILDCGAAVAIPIRSRHETIGVVVFGFRRPVARIDEADVERAQVVVAEAAQAIENAHLYAEATRRAEEWQILSKIGQAITEELDESRVIPTLVESTAQILRADACSLLLLDKQARNIRLRGQLGLSAEHAEALNFAADARVPACLALDGAPHITADLARQAHYPAAAVQDGLRTMLSVPLVERGEQAVGALTVYAGHDRRFTVADVGALSALASFGLVALGNASRYRRERQIARALQGPFVDPDGLSSDGLEIAVRSLPALREADIGGDYFDTIPLEDGRLVIAVGDVAGKGLSAAVHCQSLRWMMRTLAHEAPDPAKLLTRLNRLLFQYTPPEGFVTLFYGLYDSRNGELRYANAGHQPPLLVRSGEEEVSVLEHADLVLGVEPTAEYEEERLTLLPGDSVAMYTDGVTDAGPRGRHLEIEGVRERLRRVTRETQLPLEETVDSLFQQIRAHAGGALKDDATLLMMRVGR